MSTEKIKSLLLQERKLGQVQLNASASERLILNSHDGKPQISYHHPMRKNNASTFNVPGDPKKVTRRDPL